MCYRKLFFYQCYTNQPRLSNAKALYNTNQPRLSNDKYQLLVKRQVRGFICIYILQPIPTNSRD
jgi:hypothetical protein